MKKLTVIIPSYFPSVTTLVAIQAADVVVWADSFQFKKQAEINRTAIKAVAGAQWLTVPVLSRRKKQQRIADMQIDPQHEWKHNHLKSMQVSYQNSPYYFFQNDEIKDLLYREWRSINELSLATTQFLCRKMRITFYAVSGETLPVVPDRSERVVQWLKTCECDSYLLPEHETAFIDTVHIQQHGFQVLRYKPQAPVYHQLFNSFVRNLSGLDLLFNEGELSRMILQKALQAQIF